MSVNQVRHETWYGTDSRSSDQSRYHQQEELSRFANNRDEKPSRHRTANTSDRHLPKYQEDAQPGQEVATRSAQSNVEQTPDGKRVTMTSHDGRKSSMEYDKNGKPVKYTNFHGETFENEGPDTADQTDKTSDVWRSTTNRMQPQGVRISIDGDNQVSVTDRASRHVVTIAADGSETTKFADNQGVTTTTIDHKDEVIECQKPSQANGEKPCPPRVMHIVDNKLVSYTDSSGVTYTQTDTLMPEKDGEPYSRRPTYRAEDAKGNKVEGTFTISADRTGNVVVRNEDRPDAPNYATRELANGTVITSDEGNRVRTVTTADGLSVTTRSNDDKVVLSKTISYPGGAGKVDIAYEGGVPTHVSGAVNRCIVDYKASEGAEISERNGQIVVKDANGHSSVIKQDGSHAPLIGTVAEARNPEEGPVPIQRTPPNVDVRQNIEEAHRHSLIQPIISDPISGIVTGGIDFRSTDNAQWFKTQVNYGGVWDYKSPMSRSTDGQGRETVVNDQMRMSEYEAFGNWHYGVVGRAADFPLSILEAEAGAGQVKIGTSKPQWGSPGISIFGMHIGGHGTYGDDPEDNSNIRRGYQSVG